VRFFTQFAGGFSIVSRPLSVISHRDSFLLGFSAKPRLPNSYRSWPTLSGVSPIVLPISDGLAGSVHCDNASATNLLAPHVVAGKMIRRIIFPSGPGA